MLLDGYAGYSTSEFLPAIADDASLFERRMYWSAAGIKNRTRCLVVKEPDAIRLELAASQLHGLLHAQPWQHWLSGDLREFARANSNVPACRHAGSLRTA
jgi:hypothetical protein